MKNRNPALRVTLLLFILRPPKADKNFIQPGVALLLFLEPKIPYLMFCDGYCFRRKSNSRKTIQIKCAAYQHGKDTIFFFSRRKIFCPARLKTKKMHYQNSASVVVFLCGWFISGIHKCSYTGSAGLLPPLMRQSSGSWFLHSFE